MNIIIVIVNEMMQTLTEQIEIEKSDIYDYLLVII